MSLLFVARNLGSVSYASCPLMSGNWYGVCIVLNGFPESVRVDMRWARESPMKWWIHVRLVTCNFATNTRVVVITKVE